MAANSRKVGDVEIISVPDSFFDACRTLGARVAAGHFPHHRASAAWW
jgi:hypothetical protein